MYVAAIRMTINVMPSISLSTNIMNKALEVGVSAWSVSKAPVAEPDD